MKVVIVFPPKALESALIDMVDMAKSCCCVVCVVSLRVYQRYPSQKFTHAAILMRRKNHVTVGIHPLVRNQID